MEEKNVNLTEQQLDELIRQSFEREEIAREISVAVMKDLRRASRRAWLRRWGRAVAFVAPFAYMGFLFVRTAVCVARVRMAAVAVSGGAGGARVLHRPVSCIPYCGYALVGASRRAEFFFRESVIIRWRGGLISENVFGY